MKRKNSQNIIRSILVAEEARVGTIPVAMRLGDPVPDLAMP